jgi:DNA-binding transcriptional MerR regulator
MADDLLPTAEVAQLLGKSVATINRWATEGRLKPAVELPGETGARLYLRSDVEALTTSEALS